jgi:hypothetical protein
MPNTQALQVFYGTLPLVIMIGWAAFNNSTLLKDILKRLGEVEKGLKEVTAGIGRLDGRLKVLESRAGIVYTP